MVAIKLVEIDIPHFLTETGDHKAAINDAYYFTNIKTIQAWSEPNSGFKQKWKDSLNDLKLSHTIIISGTVPPKSGMYQLAMLSLNENCSFFMIFIYYIDSTYDNYALGKFGEEKACHITTKLNTLLINEISKPRKGTLNSLITNDSTQIGGVVLWKIIQSLDKMVEIRDLDFKNHLVVSTELVKFLSLNTSVEAIDKLKESTKTLLDDIKDLKKETGLNTKSTSTLGHNITAVEGKVTAISKCVAKLEKNN